MLTGDRPPNLAFALGKDVNQLEADDLLVGYALAAFLIEAHTERVPEVLRRCGAEENPVLVLEELFGKDLTWIQARLTAWLEQVART